MSDIPKNCVPDCILPIGILKNCVPDCRLDVGKLKNCPPDCILPIDAQITAQWPKPASAQWNADDTDFAGLHGFLSAD